MRRFFIEEIMERDGSCVISGSEARHIRKVLRMDPGDRFILMDGKGSRFQAVITSAKHKDLAVCLEKRLPEPPPSPIKTTLCQALLKSRPMDYMVQKTSELGVNRISPFSSERTVVRLEKDADRNAPAEISAISSFQELTRQFGCEEGLKLILWEEEDTKDLKEVLRRCDPARQFIGIVGPEGGFTGEEIRTAKEAGFISVSLGHRILRAETAAISLIGIVQYEWGDLSLNSKKR
ncbi:MAG: 16S rRNA (uracil(1498)-N(3))-methyltransferase [Deltaproteobacteria bacterium]|nr:16S rRNA (uracil(1498)-N(3))-methyltransferase [Deltaproteobacteria bacterium]